MKDNFIKVSMAIYNLDNVVGFDIFDECIFLIFQMGRIRVTEIETITKIKKYIGIEDEEKDNKDSELKNSGNKILQAKYENKSSNSRKV